MKSFIAIIVLILAGCGYTTRGFVYEEDSIYIKPIVNKINIARESRTHLNYSTYPILLEKKLTNALVNKFNIDGHIKVTGNSAGALRLICEVRDYKKEALRYSDSDDVAAVKKDSTSHTDPENGKTKISLGNGDTGGLIAGNYFYDVQVKKDNGDILTVMSGMIEILTDITRRVD